MELNFQVELKQPFTRAAVDGKYHGGTPHAVLMRMRLRAGSQ